MSHVWILASTGMCDTALPDASHETRPDDAGHKKARPGRTGNGLAPSPTSGCVGIVKEALSQRTLHCKKIPESSGTRSKLKKPLTLRPDRPLRKPTPVSMLSTHDPQASP
jgi:hypothetical protein